MTDKFLTEMRKGMPVQAEMGAALVDYLVGPPNAGIPEQSEGLHNALSDAVWNKETYEWLHVGEGYRRRKKNYENTKRLRESLQNDSV